MHKEKNLCIGLDCSTQSLTAIVINIDSLKCEVSLSLNFEKDFPEYKSNSGVFTNPENSGEVFSYPDMWAKALDEIFLRLSKIIDLSKVASISGSGQQHASVYLNDKKAFEKFDLNLSLAENTLKFLSRPISPIWMDTSTSVECAEIATACGGDNEVLSLTGSIATERFTAAQIRKFFKNDLNSYNNTKLIHLNSSFMCSLLAGKSCPIDYGDGAGMNLMNISSLDWDDKLLEATAPNLLDKLPSLCKSDTKVGNIANYFVKKYNFNKDCQIVAFTGDNPSSLIGVGAMLEGSAAISLGTSDTFFSSIANVKPANNAHIFGNPAGGYMSLICFRNGSLAREKIKELLNVDWNFFDNTAFENYVPQNDNKIILPFFFDEISPKLKSQNAIFVGETMSDKEKVILTIEGQFLNMLSQAKKLSSDKIDFIVLTGGASKSEGIAQTIADIFQAKVARLDSVQNSAALGAAMRSAKNFTNCSWQKLSEAFCKLNSFKTPKNEFANIYKQKEIFFTNTLNEFFKI